MNKSRKASRYAWFCLLAAAPSLTVIRAAPATDPLPEGPGKTATQRICAQCHGIEVAISSKRSVAGWRRIVADMAARGASGSPTDLEAVTMYLAAHFRSPRETVAGPEPAQSQGGSGNSASNFSKGKKVPLREEWPSYGYDPGGTRYSPLTRITPANVSKLQRAWTYHLGAVGSEATPLVIDSVMYVTAVDGIYALTPETGELLWKYPSAKVARRGLAYWAGDKSTHSRLFCGVERGKLLSIDVTTGKPAYGFGDEGTIDLRKGVIGPYLDAPFFMASPPAIYKDIVITGGSNSEPGPARGAYGDVRGWDAHSGKLVWTFHTIPHTGEPGNETWKPGSWENRSGTNVWGLMTVDESRGLVFLPLGAPTYDMYGGDRPGNNLYGNSLVALDAATGKVRWFRQLVHHDVWDFDVAAPPALINIVHGGRTIPAVAQITKMGLLFLFDRTNGKPIYGIEERVVPRSTVPGEESSPTQPFPLKPEPLARTIFSEKDLYSLTPEHAAVCKTLFKERHMVIGPLFAPLPLEGNGLLFPSTLGGGNWGGVSYNPSLGLLFSNVMNIGQWGHMVKKKDPQTGAETYVRTAEVGGAYARFWDPANHIPCQNPPFGELIAINVNTGNIAWKKPLGFFEELAAKGFDKTGTLNLGGSIATASGLTFIAATKDSRFRAFDSRSGKELWVEKIDAPAYTVPITYRGRDGRQYVAVVAGGGGSWASPTSDAVIGFALPADQ